MIYFIFTQDSQTVQIEFSFDMKEHVFEEKRITAEDLCI